MTTQTTHEPFASWAQLIDHVRAGYRLFYQAPMDYRRSTVTAIIRKDGRLRVTAPYGDADPFVADDGHLPRFSRLTDRRSA